MKICCVTVHRDISEALTEQVRQNLIREVEKAIQDGFTYFISGFAKGTDLLFAEIVLEKQKEHEAVQLEAAIPYRNRYIKLMKAEHTKAMLENCCHVEIVSEKLASNVYMKRNRYMVDRSDRVIAVYDGRETGGTVATIRLAHSKRKELREIPIYGALQ